MISVTPIQEKNEQERLCALCHVPYRADALAYVARNAEGQLAGVCQFHMNAEGGHILDLATPTDKDPDDALFVMGRAALNFMDLCHIPTAYFDGACPTETVTDALLCRIGFAPDKAGRYTISLDGFFKHPCQHC
ncbi:MAG: hypothetical protein IJY50_02140 [Clostridia bacterium]|nr:hypothetical protein [Clostridia bacterium]